MLVIQDTETVPGEDWFYVIQSTNHKISVKNFTRLYPEVVRHCLANGINPPDQQTIIDFVCANSHVPCYDSESGTLISNPWTLNLPLPPKLGCCGR